MSTACVDNTQYINDSLPIISSYSNYNINDYSTYSFKFLSSTCNPFSLETDYGNKIFYSYDKINWIYGGNFVYIDSMLGYVYVNITTNRYRLGINIKKLNNFSGITGNLISDQITSPKTYIFNYTTDKLGFLVQSNTLGCKLQNSIEYTSNITSDILRYNFDSIFGLTTSWLYPFNATFNISLTIIPNKNCNVSIYITNSLYLYAFISNILYYNNSQVVDYLILNQTYDPYWNGSVDLTTYLSSSFSSVTVKNMDNAEVFAQMDKFSVPSGYFDPLLRYYGIYANSSVLIDPTFNFSTGLIINNTFITIGNIPVIPVKMDLINATLVLSQETVITGELSITGNTSLQLNQGVLIIENQTTISGDLYITDTINVNSSVEGNGTILEILKFQNLTGKFDHIILTNISRCLKYTPVYKESSLSLVFSKDDGCSQGPGGSGGSENNDTDMTIMIVTIVLVLAFAIIIGVIVIVVFKVRWCRQRVFPHRDRTKFVAQKDKDIKS